MVQIYQSTCGWGRISEPDRKRKYPKMTLEEFKSLSQTDMMKYILHSVHLYNNRINVRCKIITDGKGEYFYEMSDINGIIKTSLSIYDTNGDINYEDEIITTNDYFY